MKRLILETSDEQFHSLHEAVDKARRNAKAVKVDREALALLLIDHSKLIRRLNAGTGDES